MSDTNWCDLLHKLTAFISTSKELGESLRQKLESLKPQQKSCQCCQSTILEPDTQIGERRSLPTIQVPLNNGDSSIQPPTANSAGDIDCLCSKSSKSSTKSKAKESFAKEKTQKLVTLKQNLTTAQQNLLDIQEQVRQLERLYQDYESFNTPEGQVNPAALYKEIMKPQAVPYITKNKPVNFIPPPSPPQIDELSSTDSLPPMPQRSPIYTQNPQNCGCGPPTMQIYPVQQQRSPFPPQETFQRAPPPFQQSFQRQSVSPQQSFQRPQFAPQQSFQRPSGSPQRSIPSNRQSYQRSPETSSRQFYQGSQFQTNVDPDHAHFKPAHCKTSCQKNMSF